LSRIEGEARGAYPRECCGLMEGARNANAIWVSALHPTRNSAPEADRFEIDPLDHFRVVRSVRTNGGRVIGCYHSHPNGDAIPSARDRVGASEDEFIWLIATVPPMSRTQFLAFVWRSGTFQPINIETDESATNPSA
jgi:proteasome lid subunit RPN8/RPN11